MKIPKIQVTKEADGWLGTCLSCGWRIGQIRRPVVDAEARSHQVKCMKEDYRW